MKKLERDLGLPSVFAISISAMIGSGIFILPALALGIAGPLVIIAYALAGLLVVPAALAVMYSRRVGPVPSPAIDRRSTLPDKNPRGPGRGRSRACVGGRLPGGGHADPRQDSLGS